MHEALPLLWRSSFDNQILHKVPVSWAHGGRIFEVNAEETDCLGGGNGSAGLPC